MSELERRLRQLHRYHDDELSGLERMLFERRLRRSPELQEELSAIEGVSTLLANADLDTTPAGVPDLWDGIARALPTVDAQVATERARAVQHAAAKGPARSGWLGLPGRAAGIAALAAAAVVALVIVFQSPSGQAPGSSQVAPVVASGGGVVRYLDSDGASVLVIEDPDADMTIVWMMDAV